MVSPRRTIALLVAVLIGALAACTPGIQSGSDRPSPTDAIVAPVPSDPAAVIGEVPAEQLDAILADAASRTDVDVADIETIRATAMTWPDGSLGCPEPGQTYTQALVDGYHVVVDAAGESLDYRATTSGSFRLCEGSGRPADG
ncbi:MAG: hypothetical protein ACRDG7_13800 [Candidatus Limnocylindria bacterium]